jgi:hypothetical protein
MIQPRVQAAKCTSKTLNIAMTEEFNVHFDDILGFMYFHLKQS